jgi:D-tyrosyl-tRNA(Tyr) deacylase
MKAVIQRCSRARVDVDGKTIGQIENGLVVFLGVMANDDENHAKRLATKLSAMRIFSDEYGKFNHSVKDVSGGILLISNFTICGDARKGNRPSFSSAAKPDVANELYERFATLLRESEIPVQTGIFAADMKVVVENDGPVTMIVEVS